jgi:hypothetical protein
MKLRRLVLLLIVCAMFVAPIALGQEQEKWNLSITDGGIGFLRWLETVSVYAVDPVTGQRAIEPAVVFKPTEDTMYALLPPGEYEVTAGVSYLGYEVRLHRVVIHENEVVTFDVRQIELPHELQVS